MEEQEREYVAASELFQHPPRVQEKSRVLLTTLAMFVLFTVARGGGSALDIATLVGVLFVHELGHALGMVVFGYTDVRIFFIPLFGAAAAGRKRGVARWKEGVVLLLGPLPGLVAGAALLHVGATGTLNTIALQLVAINAFNLLPLSPFDGGQLFQLLLFSRHRYVEVAFGFIAAVTLAVGGFYLKLYVIGAVGIFMLMTLQIRGRILGAGNELRGLELPADPAALDDAQRRTLHAALWRVMPMQWRGKHRAQAGAMEQILEIATRQPTGLGVSLALIVAWAAGIAISVLAVFTLLHGPAAQWKQYEHATPAFTVELPAAPAQTDDAKSTLYTARLGRREFAVSWIRSPVGTGWEDVVRDSFATKAGTLIREEPMPDGAPAQVVTIAGRRAWILVRSSGSTGFMVIADAEDEADAARVIHSFHTPPTAPGGW